MPWLAVRWRRRLLFWLVGALAILGTTLALLTRQPVTGPRRVNWNGPRPTVSRFWLVGDGYWTVAGQNSLVYVNLSRARADTRIELSEVQPERLLALVPQQQALTFAFRAADGESIRAGVAGPLGLIVALQTLRVPGTGFIHLLGVGGQPRAPEFLCLRQQRLFVHRLGQDGQNSREFLLPPETRPLGGYQEKSGAWVALVALGEEQIFVVREQRMDVAGDALPRGSGRLDLRAFGVLPQESATLALLPGGKLGRAAALPAGPLQWRQNGWRPPLPVTPKLQQSGPLLRFKNHPVARRPDAPALLIAGSSGFWLLWPGSDFLARLDTEGQRLDPLPWFEHLLHTRALDGSYEPRGTARENLCALFWVLFGLPILFLSWRRRPALAMALYCLTALPCLLFLLPALR